MRIPVGFHMIEDGDMVVRDGTSSNPRKNFMTTNAMLTVKCPKCNSEPRFVCRTPLGRRASCHGERTKAYSGPVATVKLISGTELAKKLIGKATSKTDIKAVEEFYKSLGLKEV